MSGTNADHSEPLPRYSLWALAILTTLCGMIFATLRLLGPMAAIMTTILLAAIAAHLAASYLGHRLGFSKPRDSTNDPPVARPTTTIDRQKPRWKAPNLAERTGLSWWQFGLIVQASTCGAVMGILSSSWVPPQKFNYAVVAVCMLSGAALCGIACFLIGSFVEHIWRSLESAWQGEYQ